MALQSFKTRGLSAGSLFKLLLVGYLCSVGLLMVIGGIFALFGADIFYVYHHLSATQNDLHYVTGVKGLLFGVIGAPIISLISAAINWVFIGFGQWLYTRFKHIYYNLKISDKHPSE
ncbi:MAG: hypothetical protein K0U29_07045 [Gammaproteobacteria bacterium]|nr:hypothetical protein [Gammaproteobacteria bacterium]MCH9744671.1 hypothetical protein [Gammaproteobacteria bacterium]